MSSNSVNWRMLKTTPEYRPKRIRMSSETEHRTQFRERKMAPRTFDLCRYNYNRHMGMPIEGMQYYTESKQTQIWRDGMDSPYLYAPCEFKDTNRRIPTSINDFHLEEMAVPGHPKYVMPERIPQNRTWEVYTIPKPPVYVKRQPRVHMDRWNEPKPGDYVPQVKEFTLRHRRQANKDMQSKFAIKNYEASKMRVVLPPRATRA